MGFMQGLLLDTKLPVGQVVSKGLEHGLVVLSAGGNVLRLLPPLVVGEEEIDLMKTTLEEIFDAIEV